MLVILAIFYTQYVVADVTVGQLFFTPEQRKALDKLRTRQHSTTVTPNVRHSEHSKRGSDKTNIQGYVKRSDARQSTIWVDGKALQKEIGHHHVLE